MSVRHAAPAAAIALFALLICLPIAGAPWGDGPAIEVVRGSGSAAVIPVWRVSALDDTACADSAWDDSDWTVLAMPDTGAPRPEPHWYRARIHITGGGDELDIAGIYLRRLSSAYAVYWDGRLLLRNGVVGATRDSEVPGRMINLLRIPPSLSGPGEHVLAIRRSDFHGTGEGRFPSLPFGDAEFIGETIDRIFNLQVFHSGLFFLGALFSFALFLGGGGQRPYLLFTVYCLAVVVDSIVNAAVIAASLPIDLLPYIEAFYTVITPLSIVMLGIFFTYHYHLPAARYHAIAQVGLAMLLVLVFGRDHALWLGFYLIGILAWAIHTRQPGSVVALTGVVFAFVLSALYLFGQTFYGYSVGMMIFLFCMTLSISRHIRRQNLEHEQARLRTARLQTELLKRHIQPHFLMNTLLSIRSWIEADPGKAGELIQALASEYRMVNGVMQEREIDLEREIELCRNHLRLMSLRKDARYDLRTGPLPAGQKIPPMVLHTLVENGLTHAFGGGEDGHFELTVEADGPRRVFRLWNGGERLTTLAERDREAVEEGLGMRYVRTRLEESYPGRWSLDYGPRGSGWEVRIEVAG